MPLGSSINDVTQFKTIFDTPSPHFHMFYYKGTVITKSLTPSSLRPRRHIWTTPFKNVHYIGQLSYSYEEVLL